MKKTIIFFEVFCILFVGQIVMAGCPTGYACLLKDLKIQETVIKNIQKKHVDKIYNPKTTEPSLDTIKNKKENDYSYKDLLPFSPKYY